MSNFIDDEEFTDLADLWEFVTSVGPSGPNANSHTLHSSGVPCLFRVKQSIEGPSLVGLVAGDDITTSDFVRLAENSPIESKWIIVNRTSDSQESYNKGWVVDGDPSREYSTPSFPEAGITIAFVKKEGQLPAALRTHYGI